MTLNEATNARSVIPQSRRYSHNTGRDVQVWNKGIAATFRMPASKQTPCYSNGRDCKSLKKKKKRLDQVTEIFPQMHSFNYTTEIGSKMGFDF